MPSHDGKGPKPGRDEFEIAYYTKELGPLLQRKLLKQRLADFSESRSTDAGEGATAPPATDSTPPPDKADRAD